MGRPGRRFGTFCVRTEKQQGLAVHEYLVKP